MDIPIERWTDKPTDRPMDIPTERQTDKPTDRFLKKNYLVSLEVTYKKSALNYKEFARDCWGLLGLT